MALRGYEGTEARLMKPVEAIRLGFCLGRYLQAGSRPPKAESEQRGRGGKGRGTPQTHTTYAPPHTSSCKCLIFQNISGLLRTQPLPGRALRHQNDAFSSLIAAVNRSSHLVAEKQHIVMCSWEAGGLLRIPPDQNQGLCRLHSFQEALRENPLPTHAGCWQNLLVCSCYH